MTQRSSLRCPRPGTSRDKSYRQHGADARAHRLLDPLQVRIGVCRRQEARAALPNVNAVLDEVVEEQVARAGEPEKRRKLIDPQRCLLCRKQGVQTLAKSRRARVQRFLKFRAGCLEVGEHRLGGCHGQRVLVERPGEERARFLRDVITLERPYATVNGIQELVPAGNDPDRQPAADDLAVRDHVGSDIGPRLRASQGDPEPQEDVIEHQGGAGLFGKRSKLLQKLPRLQARPAALDRFDNHGRQVAGNPFKRFKRTFGIAIVQDEGVLDHAVRRATGQGRAAAVGRRTGERAVKMTVIGAGEHGHQRSPGRVPSKSEGGHHGLGTGVAEHNPLVAGQPGNTLGNLAGQRCLGPYEYSPLGQMTLQGVGHEVRVMTEKLDAEAHGQGHIVVAVQISHMAAGAFGADDGIEHRLRLRPKAGDRPAVGRNLP